MLQTDFNENIETSDPEEKGEKQRKLEVIDKV